MGLGGATTPALRNTNAALRTNAEKLIVLLLWVVLALILFLNKRGIFTPDIKPEIYLAPGRSSRDLLFSWLENQQLGIPNFNVGLAPVAGVVWLMHGLGLSPATCMRVLRLVLLMLGWAGAARFYGHVAGARSHAVGRVLAGVVYVANPYVVVAGDTLAIVLPLALLPWQVLFFTKALETGRGWRWPAAFALTFVAMSGMNAGVVPALQLVYVPCVILYVLRRTGRSLGQLLGPMIRCAALALLVSLYWLIPAIAASGVGNQVLSHSETYRGIAGPSSFSEVLRGLGLWPMYGHGPSGPWQPGFTPYLTNPLVIAASFALPVMVAASTLIVRGVLRRLALLMVCTAAVVMVGLYPPGHPTPVGRAMRFAMDHLPGTGALRTTNKAGSVLILGSALLIASAGEALARRHPPRRLMRSGAVLAILLVGGVWPAVTGGLFSDRLMIPSYWTSAADVLDRGSPHQRIWLVPGEVRSHYRWSQERVDDIDKSLLSRPTVVQYTIPAATAESANFLTAVDTLMQEGALPPGTVSAAARYLGASDVLVRNDLVWEQTGGARPELVQEQVAPDTGLRPAGVFGRPGENTVTPSLPSQLPFGAQLPPLQRYTVTDSRQMLRIEPLAGSVLIDGDGWAFAPLVAAGLLDGQPAFRYVGETDAAQLGQALRAGTRLVITDTNRRRASLTDRLANSQGPLLGATQATGASRTLFTNQASQTTLTVEGGGQVSATSVGSVFGQLPYSAPENAFDGDERTSWVFGDFGTAVGQSIRLHLNSPRVISRLHLVMRPRGPVLIDRVSLQVGGTRRTVVIPPTGIVDVSIPATRASLIRMTVLHTTGEGINLVAVDEIGIPGVRLVRVARTPTRLTTLLGQIDAADRARVIATPIDVVFWRVRGTPPPEDDEETGLNRDFELPRARTFRLYGLVRPDSAASDDRIDRLLGYTGNVTATSSSRLFNSPDVRASAAVDGNLFTDWSPADPVLGQWLSLSGGLQRIDHIDVVQPVTSSAFISKAQVLLDGRPATLASLNPGLTRIRLRPQSARRVTMVITARTGTGPVRVSELRFGNAHIRHQPSSALRSCVPVAELDGRPLLMRPLSPLTDMGPSIFAGCGAPLSLPAGVHRLRAVHAWMPDELVLRDLVGDHGPTAVPVATGVTTEQASPTHWRLTADFPAGPQVVVLGQNYDPRWAATIDGRSVGRTVAADGYSAAWIVNAPGRHTLDIRFGPQRASTVGLVISAAAVVLCLALVGTSRVARSAIAPSDAPGARRPVVALRRTMVAASWSLTVLAAWLLGGIVIGAAALILAAWHAWRPPPPRRLIVAAVTLFALCPAAFIIGNASRWGVISPNLVLDNEWPHWLAGTALLVLVVGVWREDAADRTTDLSRPVPLSDSAS